MERLRSERGANLIEYSILLACVAAICVAAVTYMGQRVDSTLDVHVDPASSVTP